MPNLSTLARQWMPPILYTWLLNIQQSRKHPLLQNYQEALSKCSTKGYENDQLIDVMHYKMERYLMAQKTQPDTYLSATQTFTLLALSKVMAYKTDDHTISVLDFGGSLGGHYFDAKRVFGDTIKLKWAVVETTAMAEAGRSFENAELKFFDNLPAALNHLKNIDLVHTSGTLQCVDDAYKYLNELLEIKANFILFNRLGLNRKNRDVVTIHHSKLSWNGHFGLPPGVEDRVIKYPFSFMAEERFLSLITAKYRIIHTIQDDSGIFALPTEQIVGSGLFVERI